MRLSLITLLLASSVATTAWAAADVAVSVDAPTAAPGELVTWDVVVANGGNKNADDVRVRIDLPVTQTSPTQHLLGTLGAIDGRCQVAGFGLDCRLGRVGRRSSTTVSFGFASPQSALPQFVIANATTRSSESNRNNNGDAELVVLDHPALLVSAGDVALVEHCTGTLLSSFYECELYPSSITDHGQTFLAGGAVDLGVPGYSGTWLQPSPERLDMTYFQGTTAVAWFAGYAVDADCFEGVTSFPNSGYLSVYRVCLQ